MNDEEFISFLCDAEVTMRLLCLAATLISFGSMYAAIWLKERLDRFKARHRNRKDRHPLAKR